MKVVFAGPSVYGLRVDWEGLSLRPPAALGDISRAVNNGASTIGLIDGYFGWTPAVCHKEILYALSCGATVMGAASMGALRAAECQRYGMLPVGQIAAWYCNGTLDDDGDVALLHYPEEAGYAPYTEALVDVRATLDHLRSTSLINAEDHLALWHAAHSLNFRDRTVHHIVAAAVDRTRAAAVEQTYQANRVSLKGQDALTLVTVMRCGVAAESSPNWAFAESFVWRQARA